MIGKIPGIKDIKVGEVNYWKDLYSPNMNIGTTLKAIKRTPTKSDILTYQRHCIKNIKNKFWNHNILKVFFNQSAVKAIIYDGQEHQGISGIKSVAEGVAR
jgi:hypothetical protein